MTAKSNLEVRPIGTVRRLSDGECLLELDPACEAGLHGAEPGGRLEVFYWMHRLGAGERRRLKVHPRGDPGRPLRGVFTLRSPMRPNPIGATLVDIRRVEGARLWVTGLDALDGSPVIDIKTAGKA